MYITELFKNKENITYTYTKRNTDIPCPPDFVKEETDSLIYDSKNGNLFCGKPIAFKGSNLLGGSVDITVNMKKRYFVDHVTLSQSEGSKIGSIDVFSKENGALKIIATLSRGEFLEDKDITISVGYFCDVVVIRLNCAYLNMGLDALEVHAAAELENTVYPIPNEIKLTGGILPFNKIKSVTAETPEALSAAEYLCEKLNQKYGLSLSSKDDGEIVLNIDERDDDGYSVEVTDSGCRISAGKKRAFFYGADTLVQLCTEGGIKCATVSDSPMMELRGMHFALPSRSELPFLRKVIRDILVPMRYNIVFIQISAIMRYEKFPEINDMWLTACE